MTRFARAKGSKASNERLPEPATSWSEMKQALVNKSKEINENKERAAALEKRQSNYEAFLREKEQEQESNTSWATFPGQVAAGRKVKLQDSSKKRQLSFSVDNNNDSSASPKKKKAKKANANPFNQTHNSDEDFIPLKVEVDKVLNSSGITDDTNEPLSSENKSKEKAPQGQNKRAKNLKKKRNIEENLSVDTNKNFSKSGMTIDQVKIKRNKKLRGKKTNDKTLNKQGKENPKAVPVKKSFENLSESELAKVQKKNEKRIRQAEKRRKLRADARLKKQEEGENTFENERQPSQKNFEKNTTSPTNKHFQKAPFSERKPYPKTLEGNQKPKQGKKRDNKEHQRRKPQPQPEKMFINGKTVEIDYIDGFPVKKEDAERLRQLRKEMISKGLPRSEINVALKLERRRAEKALAREKKNVCFKCRKSGHNLSECPELEKDQVAESGTGICFKCGSTEHTHFECKVVKGQEFKFATCFICNEQGHIARQCPDNQRGLYPKGGACKVCGDVTHLKKDCPKYQAQQAQLQNSLSVDVLDSGNPDDIGGKNFGQNVVNSGNRKSNKVIKF